MKSCGVESVSMRLNHDSSFSVSELEERRFATGSCGCACGGLPPDATSSEMESHSNASGRPVSVGRVTADLKIQALRPCNDFAKALRMSSID